MHDLMHRVRDAVRVGWRRVQGTPVSLWISPMRGQEQGESVGCVPVSGGWRKELTDWDAKFEEMVVAAALSRTGRIQHADYDFLNRERAGCECASLLTTVLGNMCSFMPLWTTGLPDCFLYRFPWRNPDDQNDDNGDRELVKLVEAKGPNDSLRAQQEAWIARLHECGSRIIVLDVTAASEVDDEDIEGDSGGRRAEVDDDDYGGL